jgi:hypothetical protein
MPTDYNLWAVAFPLPSTGRHTCTDWTLPMYAAYSPMISKLGAQRRAVMIKQF